MSRTSITVSRNYRTLYHSTPTTCACKAKKPCKHNRLEALKAETSQAMRKRMLSAFHAGKSSAQARLDVLYSGYEYHLLNWMENGQRFDAIAMEYLSNQINLWERRFGRSTFAPVSERLAKWQSQRALGRTTLA